MKVGLIEKPGVLKIADRDAPAITKDTDVLVKIKRVGICGSDTHIFHGKNPFAVYPRVWGHEFVGEVRETGSAVRAVKKGDHVVVEPIIYCGTCYACRQGRGNVCASLQVMGVHIDGGCQEMIAVPEANCHLIPSSLPWEEAVLIEPFTIGAQACYRGNVLPGDYVFVMGAGTIGLTAAAMAKLAGGIVIISDIVPEKLDYARSRGVDYVINAKETDANGKVREITGGMGANVTIDAVCSKKSFEDCIDVTSVAGRIVELSMSETASEIVPKNIMAREISIYGSRLQTRRFPVVIDYLKKGQLQLKGFVTAEYPLDKMADAFAYIDAHNDAVRKIIVKMPE
ncbi:MAG: zinc-binding alcohol dehydrogenase family protein [Spirochaetaceae bacterium]|jgi:L-gulonate 5-dehydrogenase|nr:zinc-binding alcohol dehydrogenase family protein [Spirochaetaceae bacterium]